MTNNAELSDALACVGGFFFVNPKWSDNTDPEFIFFIERIEIRIFDGVEELLVKGYWRAWRAYSPESSFEWSTLSASLDTYTLTPHPTMGGNHARTAQRTSP